MTQPTVSHLDLQDYLQGKCASPRVEASTIWTLLVHHTVRDIGGRGLPLKLICDICGQGYGECQDNRYMNNFVNQIAYWPPQTQHWTITISSLKEGRRVLNNMEIRLLGSPEKPRPRRKLLYAWIDSL